MTYRNAKGQFCEDPAEAAARKAAFVQNEIDDIEAAGVQRMVGSLLLGCALLLGALIGVGTMWHYMHNDLATGYRLGRIQGQKDGAEQERVKWRNAFQLPANIKPEDVTAVYAITTDSTPTAQGSEVKR